MTEHKVVVDLPVQQIETPFIDPLSPLTIEGLELAIPKNFDDAYVWVAYLADGSYVSEARKGIGDVKWNDISIAQVTFIDLIPVPLVCPDHRDEPSDGCVKCYLVRQRGALRPHRLQVPEGGAAHFERRRVVDSKGRRQQTWTILGWQRHILAGPRHLLIAYYLYIDDLGRTFSSPRLDVI